ncbi:hypothetical protein BH10BAC1_BH10BAC1_21040 [soil metagenome]
MKKILVAFIYLLLATIVFIFLFFYYLLVVASFESFLSLKITQVAWPSLQLFFHNTQWPIVLSLLTTTIGIFIHFKFHPKKKTVSYSELLLTMTVLFLMFSWFYFPHVYIKKAYTACSKLDYKKEFVTLEQFKKLHGAPDSISLERDGVDWLYDKSNMDGWEGCILKADANGVIKSVDFQIPIY